MKSEYHAEYYRKNKENYIEYQKEYIKIPEVKVRRAERERERRKNPDVKKYHDDYEKRNRKRINEYQKEYNKRPEVAEKIKEYKRKYYLKKKEENKK